MIAVLYPGDNRHIAVDIGPDTLIQRAPSALRGCQEGIIAIPAGFKGPLDGIGRPAVRIAKSHTPGVFAENLGKGVACDA